MMARVGALAALALLALAGEPPGPVRHTTDGLPKQRPSWSPDGALLTFSRFDDGGTEVRQYVVDPSRPESLRRLTDRGDPEYNGVFSPGGDRVWMVVIGLSGTQGNLDVGWVPAAGGEATRLDFDGGRLAHQDWPSPSPDGARIAFSSTHEGNQEIYVAKADGSEVVRLTQSPGIDAHPCWMPDGSAVVFATDRWGGLELARVGLDGTGLGRLTESPGLDDYPAVSPDGRRIAFVSHRDGQFEVYACDADGANPVNLSDHPGRDTFPCWTPDSLGVTFVSDRGGGQDLYSLRREP